jgi:hypothetical protein
VSDKQDGLIGYGQCTLEHIGWRLGITRERARQLVTTGIKKVRASPLVIMHSPEFDEDNDSHLMNLVSACDRFLAMTTPHRMAERAAR